MKDGSAGKACWHFSVAWALKGNERACQQVSGSKTPLFLGLCRACKAPAGGGGYVQDMMLLRTSLGVRKLNKPPRSTRGREMTNCSNIVCVLEKLCDYWISSQRISLH